MFNVSIDKFINLAHFRYSPIIRYTTTRQNKKNKMLKNGGLSSLINASDQPVPHYTFFVACKKLFDAFPGAMALHTTTISRLTASAIAPMNITPNGLDIRDLVSKP